MSSFFRYPGGKSKLRKQIIEKINGITRNNGFEYREPFFGGGSIGLLMLENNSNINKIWINDFNLGIASLWTALIKYPDLFKKKIQEFIPSVEAFYKFKEELTSKNCKLDTVDKIVDYGFKKLAIHQISYSGLGTKSGGPLGGRDQKSAYKIDCRWSPTYICKKIDALNTKFSELTIRNNTCTNLDFAQLIEDDSCPAVIYLDPPYYDKGSNLYQDGFEEEDHKRLADCLKKTDHQWILSYDDCPEIRRYYNWANIEIIDGVNYSITATKDKSTGERKSRVKPELLISKKSNIFSSVLINGE